MNKETRTSKSIQNAKIALLFYFINLVLSFFSRKIFLEYLGAEVLGLNTTAQNLLGFLNLAELGIGSAISYALYRPIFEKNTQTINEIVSVQGYLYRKIAYIVFAAAVVFMFFFPWIFEKAEIPLWYAYATFVVLLCSSLFSYLWNYRQIVLTADQKEYKVTINLQGFKIIKVLLQIAAMVFLFNGYLWWLVLEFIMAVITVVVLNWLLKKEYPWLKSSPGEGKILKQKYPIILSKTKQIFFHKIGGFVLTQTSPLIIYAYTSLTLVAFYGNYMLIVAGVTLLLSALFNSINAGIGNLVAEGDRKRVIKVFDELFSSRFWFVSTICFAVYLLTPSFITLWIGQQYLLDNLSFILIIAIMYINLIRTVVDSFISAYGLFQDIWATLTEAALNLGCSLGLGYFWGLPGILSGVLISLLLIIFSWKPYFLFRWGFKLSVTRYFLMYAKHFLWGGIAFFISLKVAGYITINISDSFLMLGIYACLTVGFYFILSGVLLYCFCSGMKNFTARFMNFICR